MNNSTQARNGFGATPTASWTFLVAENLKRKWVSVNVPADAADAVMLCLTYGSNVSKQYGLVQVEKGGSAVFNCESKDMFWQGSILARGVDADSEVVWCEVYDE